MTFVSVVEYQIAGINPVVDIHPKRGCIKQNASVDVTVRFSPTCEGPINLNLPCMVGATKHTINIKGIGYRPKATLHLTQEDGTQEEIHPGHWHSVNFGQVKSKSDNFEFIGVS